MLRIMIVLSALALFAFVIPNTVYANHDSVPSYVQNNTGWDREFFHEYTLYRISDEFGFIIFPILLNNFVLAWNAGSNPYSDDSRLGNITLYINASNVDGDIRLAFPNVLEYDHEGIDMETSTNKHVPSIFNQYTNTHTHATIPKESLHDEINFSSGGFLGGMPIDSGLLNIPNSTDYDYLFPPLKQTQNGVEPQNILCKENLELVLRANDSPACVTSESTPKLIERGWKKIN